MQKIDSLHPDLISMDIHLPGENGLQLTRRTKIKYPDIRVIILTGSGLPEYREAAQKYGASYFIIKGSMTMEKIQDLVRSIVS